jgi:UDP-N-acetylmuramoyl-L-alanyl-D-glutamate--2,6-diaminopimelate ligase
VNLVLKTFSELLECANVLEKTAANSAITAVEYDSRKIKPGALFVAMRGESTDGNKFISAAIEQGAVAVVTDSAESFVSLKQKNMPAALVQHGRRALAAISAEFFSHPEAKLKLHGITGTNGKTTTAFLLETILCNAGRECVLVGTVEYHVAGEVLASPHTTPESRDLMEMFARGVEAGATDGVMEMSSHALEQERVWGLHCDTAIFTNLTQDHLDYHGTMEKYLAAKRRLFEGVGANPPRVAVLNADDPHSNELLPAKNSMQIMLYGIEKGDYRAEQIELAAGSTRFILQTPSGSAKVQTHLTGQVNVYNALAAICAAMASGMKLEAASAGASALNHVPGRFQVARGNQRCAI